MLPFVICFVTILEIKVLIQKKKKICLPMQRTQVRALVREDPTCHRSTKPMGHNY